MRGTAVKEQKRTDADERNAAYQKLSFEDKMARNSKKVQGRLEVARAKAQKKTTEQEAKG